MKSGNRAKSPEPRRRVVVAMSGGVDSSVAAALLKKAGSCAESGRSIDVVGVMMKFWRDPSASSGQVGENRCCSVESEKLARLVAKKIGIPFYVINVEKEFKKKVVDYFLKEYKAGNTPNPCVVCNKEIKFGLLIEKSLKLGADFIATGHYARQQSFDSARPNARQSNFFSSRPLHWGFPSPQKNLLARSVRMLKGKDKEKDQSYFLWQLSQKQLSKVLFPVGGYTKTEVRKLAKKFDLPTAETPESQEVCFVNNTTNEFLKKYLKTKPGKIVELWDVGRPTILGQHKGLWFYTIGQRRGLEIPQGSAFVTQGERHSGETKPWYVVDKDFKKNILVVSKNQKDLLKKELVAGNVNWVLPQKLPLNAEVKIRYKSNLVKAKIIDFNPRQKIRGRVKYDEGINGENVKNTDNTDKVKVIFSKPQKAITPGQSVVFYLGQELLGGGVIE